MSSDAGTPEVAAPLTAPLGDIEAARSRHAGRRSTVAICDDTVVVGTADGRVIGFDAGTLERRWESTDGDAGLVEAVAISDGGTEAVVVGERGADGEIRCHDAATGTVRWRYRSADDVGEPTKDTRFFLPFVASLAAADDRVYAAARRYERGKDGSRHFESVVYAFDVDGTDEPTVAWTYAADASPISVDATPLSDADSASDGRVAVGYNRCTGDHQRGLVVLDAADGSERWSWDPGNDGQRRVGDVSLLDDGLAVTSHGDYRGYRLGAGGDVRWTADLATPEQFGDETLYAYPNHVHATERGILFVTGNTYPEEGRQTESRHPDEHTAFGYTPEGEWAWSVPVEGFVTGLGTDGDRVVAPAAQNFRERDAGVHGVCVFDVAEGTESVTETAGVAVAGATADGRVAAVEEPVEYHDEGVVHGAYRLHRTA
jgi:outer membrane protein assembly factor BamB